MRDVEDLCKKLGVSKEEFISIMKEENKTYKNYKNSSNFIALGVKIAQLMGIEKRQYR